MTETMTEPVRIGLAGFGYWGTKLARNCVEADDCELVVVCDGDGERRDAARRQYGVATVAGFDELVAVPDLDAVICATPAEQHARHARAALMAGKHVMVEKPLATTTADCDALVALAQERRLQLMSGHTFLYSPAVELLKQLVDSGELGEILYCYSQRLSLGAIRDDTSAMWDLAPHDISIFLHLFGVLPRMVTAQQFSLLGARREDIAMVTMAFPSGAVGHVHVSRLDPRKVRELTIVGDRKMVVYDDTDPELPVRIYDRGVDRELLSSSGPLDPGFGFHKLSLRTGDVYAPNVSGSEPLRAEIDDFVGAVRGQRRPLSDGRIGRDVVAVLEAADRSSVIGGEPMALSERQGGAGLRAA